MTAWTLAIVRPARAYQFYLDSNLGASGHGPEKGHVQRAAHRSMIEESPPHRDVDDN